MVKEYTEIWNGFQIREPVFLTGKKDPYMFDLVNWEAHNPIEVTELSTGKKKISTRSCFTVGTIRWDTREPGFEFESCGLRFLENYVEGLNQFVLDFCEKQKPKMIKRMEKERDW